MGSLTSDRERFLAWRAVKAGERDPFGEFGKDRTLFAGLFNPGTLLSILKNFVVFEHGDKTSKMVPAYHQFYAVEKAFTRAAIASSEGGDGKGGLMWHTQGSGKSYEMACLAGMLSTSASLGNPTVVVVTDRKNLDHQLFDTFVGAKALLRQEPIMAESREQLRDLLDNKPSGGVMFTTIQKFSTEEEEQVFPVLTERRNVFVFTDEAHRSQYGFSARVSGEKFKVGYAQHLRDALPNATFFAFTGTPVESADKDTRQVFGDEIDVYDMLQANEDGATVPIFYENRQVPLRLSSESKAEIDKLADSLVEDEEEALQSGILKKWAELEQIAGAEPRLAMIASDLVAHFENRCKSPELQNGKAMIVAMSRNVCVDLYNEIVKIRPDWHSDDIKGGAIKIVFHASASESQKIRPHVYTEPQKRTLENRFKDPDDELKLVIVRDMWLTGFSSSPCHTLYVDKPMKGHNLMQAIARVNRVFGDKPGGLIVDYIGIATELKEALATYTRGAKSSPPVSFIEDAIGVFTDKLNIVFDLLHGCDLSKIHNKPHEAIPEIANFVVGLEDGKRRFADVSTALSKAYALVNSRPEAIAFREEVAVFQAIRVMLMKNEHTAQKLRNEEREILIRQAVSKGIVPEGIIDIFSAAGLASPNIGLLSEEFLSEIRTMKERNLAAEALTRLLEKDIKARFKSNIVQKELFSDLLEGALGRYRNRSIETAQLIEELIDIAETLNKKVRLGNPDGLSDAEVAFYDALELNKEAVREMKHEDVVQLARELTKKVKANIRVDWSVRESTQAALRTMVRDLLDRYGYPPDFSNAAIETVIQQAESLTEEWLAQGSGSPTR
jgi:type I restriction enzyme R subunit